MKVIDIKAATAEQQALQLFGQLAEAYVYNTYDLETAYLAAHLPTA